MITELDTQLVVEASLIAIYLPVNIITRRMAYRQQNVRQRQKLISIIDYDVCMTFY